MKKILVITLFLAVLFSQAAFACWSPPQPFEIYSEDGSRVFWFIFYDEQGLLESGVYDTATGELIYAIDDLHGATSQNEMFFSSDMRYLAYIRPNSIPAVQFFADGQLIHSYYANDLVRSTRQIMDLSIGPQWRRWDSPVTFADNRLTLTTIDGITYTFDITIGRIIARRGFYTIWDAVIVIAVLLPVVYILYRVVKRRRWLAANPPRPLPPLLDRDE